MKKFILFPALIFGIQFSLNAANVPNEIIDSEAKWLVHIDLNNFRKTKLGDVLSKKFTEILNEQENTDLLRNLKLDFLPQNIHSITAYGTGYQASPESNGVLILKTTVETDEVITQILEAFNQLKAGSAKVPVSIIKDESSEIPLYVIDNELHVTSPKKGYWVIGKSQSQVKNAIEVLGGRRPNLTQSTYFNEFPKIENNFFFLALAKSFNKNINLPLQAEVLKSAEGGRVLMGEENEHLFLSVAIMLKDQNAAIQIQTIIQGTLALAMLTQSDNSDLLELVQAIKVSNQKNNVVDITLKYPIQKLLDHIANNKFDFAKP